MTVASQPSRELIALEGGAARPATSPPSMPMPGSPAASLGGSRPSQQLDRDSYSVTALADVTDRALHAATARFTAGVSPAALAQAYLDWATHLACAPGKRARLVDKAMRKAMRFGNYVRKYALSCGKIENCIDPLPQDHRFTDAAWQKFPFNFVYQSFLLQQQWWHNATTGLRGVSKSTRTWSNSPHGRCSTCSRRRISR